MPPSRPDQLHDLMGEIEHRLSGFDSPTRLTDGLAKEIPDKPTYIVVVFDGLGVAQLGNAAAGTFRETQAGVVRSPFPTTTSVALSSIATARSPAVHGLNSHLMWMPALGKVVNTLKWVDLTGEMVVHDYGSVLPFPNLWERLRLADIEPITVQPASFQGSPLSRMLYRGARFEAAWDDDDLVEATVQLASEPRRLIFTYHWQIDFAGHVYGLGSPEFEAAVSHGAALWDRLSTRLPDDVGLIGTADHGLIEYADADKIIVRDPRFDALRFGGDSRGIEVWGDPGLIDEFVSVTGGLPVDVDDLYEGSKMHDMGDRLILAPPGKVILPPGFDKRLRCYHGGLDPAETEVPLLIG